MFASPSLGLGLGLGLGRFVILTKKNLLIISRHPISTTIRALVIPLLIVLILSFSKSLFNSNTQKYGISTASPVLALSQALSHAGARRTVVFCDNGLTGGDISRVIESITAIVDQSGLKSVRTSNASDLGERCQSTHFAASPCFAGVLFFSSPTEGPGGMWNYTLGADESLGGTANVDKTTNDAQIFLMPLQRAIDAQIIAISGMTLPETVNQIQYTYGTAEAHEAGVTADFLNACAYFLGPLFFLALVPVLYHMTGFIARERELGMSALLDASGFSLYGPQLLRLSSTYLAFVAVYGISWFCCGIIIATTVFHQTNGAITVIYHLLNGLALCSFSLLGAVFFRKAQLSGIFVVVVAVVLAILAQLLAPEVQTYSTVLALSLVFPSANYTYMISTIAHWELAGLKTDLVRIAPDSPFQISGGTFWGFLVFQIVAYPMLAVFIEQLLFGTSSRGYVPITSPMERDPSVKLVEFSKTYKPNFLKRIFKRNTTDVHAVKGLNLVARSGTITMLLGPNGCGKSTTLEAIAGLSKISNGSIEIDRTGGLGFAPQRNVLWDDLTVKEHVRILTVLKSTGARDVEAEVNSLIKGCDLEMKANAKAKTLSGGQKRKLQLAMMFAGGSRVCCVDEVSTGVDPVSRRKIWDILLARRQGVCIIMTTHFLDEADWLADEIIIMVKGEERANGSSAELKYSLGNGYSVHVSSDSGFVLPANIEIIEKIESERLIEYRVATSAQATILINTLEASGSHGFSVSGPTIEELFLKMTKDDTPVVKNGAATVREMEDGVKALATIALGLSEDQHLLNGTEVSMAKQGWFLFRKRCTIFRRNWLPYFFALTIALIGSGVTPLIFKQYKRLPCPQDQNFDDAYYDSSFGSHGLTIGDSYIQMLMGPRSLISDASLQVVVNLYNTSRSLYGYSNIPTLSTFLDHIYFVDTVTEFTEYLSQNQSDISPGGLFLSNPPMMAWVGGQSFTIGDSVFMQNLLNMLTSTMVISTSYETFSVASTPQLIDFSALIFVIIFGLVFSCYPAFFSLYPTTERLRGVRAMQYSNGVRPAALWLAYCVYDTILVVLISIIATVLLAIATDVWFELPYIFVVLLFYGITSAILSYIISMFAPSPLAAWSLVAAIQIVLYFAIFAAYIGIQAKVPYLQVAQETSYVQWTVGIISPGANLQRALYVSLGLYTLTCGQSANPSDWSVYGGPIAYLVVQGCLFFVILLLWDNKGFSRRILWWRRETTHTSGNCALVEAGMQSEHHNLIGVVEDGQMFPATSGINLLNTTKCFRTNRAVDNVTLLIPPGETFALLGPNGAGKSTVISLIRGDLDPTTKESSINIDNISVRTHRNAARSKIGVCPQFDASDVMTVTESLLFFARMRGVSNPAHNVAVVIKACGLEPWAKKLAQTLSGGTKRKLSLAQALVGNPKVLLLDEPSSSLDAASKRVLWSTLSTLSKDRSVLLTTHSMEEAQVLADRVGIMSSRMLVTGTVDEMCHDNVYHVHLVAATAPHTTLEEIDSMIKWVRHNIPDAKMDRETYCGQVRFSVVAEPGFSVGKLFTLLENGKEQLNIGFYSLGKTTLDEVFVRVVRAHGGREENSYAEEKLTGWKRW